MAQRGRKGRVPADQSPAVGGFRFELIHRPTSARAPAAGPMPLATRPSASSRSLVNAVRSGELGLAAARARRSASGLACSTPTLPTSWHLDRRGACGAKHSVMLSSCGTGRRPRGGRRGRTTLAPQGQRTSSRQLTTHRAPGSRRGRERGAVADGEERVPWLLQQLLQRIPRLAPGNVWVGEDGSRVPRRAQGCERGAGNGGERHRRRAQHDHLAQRCGVGPGIGMAAGAPMLSLYNRFGPRMHTSTPAPLPGRLGAGLACHWRPPPRPRVRTLGCRPPTRDWCTWSPTDTSVQRMWELHEQERKEAFGMVLLKPESSWMPCTMVQRGAFVHT